MVRLSAIQQENIKTITIEIADEEVAFKVDTNALTIGWDRRFNNAARAGDISGVADTFFSLVKDWDITDDDDEKLPLDESSVDLLSIATFTQITQLLLEELDPNDLAPMQAAKKKSKPSRRR